MNNESMTICEGIEIAESVLLVRERGNRYGSVPGLEDDELADPDELERQVYRQEWGPVLALPVQGRRSVIQPVIAESGQVDWGAFATVDFDRYSGGFDKARYKAEKLREQLLDLLIRIGIVRERLPGKAKYVVLKYVRMGIIGLEHIADADMLIMARLWLRARRLDQEVGRLHRASAARSRVQLARLLVE